MIIIFKLKWFPPSWFQIKYKNKVIYIDPAYLDKYFEEKPQRIEFSRGLQKGDSSPLKNLEKADIILITHHHYDHCQALTLKKLKKDNTSTYAPSICEKELGVDFIPVAPGDDIRLEDISFKVVPAYNTPEGSSTHKFHPKDQGVGFLIKLGDKTIYHAGDTDFIPEMSDLGDLDLALIPIGGTYTMDVDEAIKSLIEINPEMAIPMHMRDADPFDFKTKIEDKSKIRVILPLIGESLEF